MSEAQPTSDVEEILARIAHGATPADLESQHLDFKEQGRSLPDTLANLASACACFANAEGGTVIVGVADRTGGTGAFVGHTLDADRTRIRIHELTEPPLLVRVEDRSFSQGRVLVIDVAKGVQIHSVGGHLPRERVGTSCMPMSAERIATVLDERRGTDWSAEDSGVATAAVDPATMSLARSLIQRLPDAARRVLARESDIGILRSLGVVTSRQRLTRAGALLFTAQHGFPELISFVHRRTPAGSLTTNEIIGGPLLGAVQRVFDMIESRIERTPVTIGRGQQIHVADLPEAAVREAVVNAVMHREYRSGSGRVSVEHTQTQLAVTSPGGFVSGVSVNNVLTTSSRPRNTSLASALRALGLAETAGTGVDRMVSEMARIGHQPPRFDADPMTVRVALIGGAPNTALARYVSTLPETEAEDADTMLLLLTLLTQRTITAESAAPLLQKPTTAEAQSVLLRLSSESVRLLEPTRESARRARPTYRLREEAIVALGAAVTYRRRTTDQIDRKVVEYVKETGTINGRVVKIMLDMDTVSASRVLADLVDRGLLIKTSPATRGPGVTYGEGPNFPAVKTTRRSRPGSTQDTLEGLDEGV